MRLFSFVFFICLFVVNIANAKDFKQIEKEVIHYIKLRNSLPKGRAEVKLYLDKSNKIYKMLLSDKDRLDYSKFYINQLKTPTDTYKKADILTLINKENRWWFLINVKSISPKGEEVITVKGKLDVFSAKSLNKSIEEEFSYDYLVTNYNASKLQEDEILISPSDEEEFIISYIRWRNEIIPNEKIMSDRWFEKGPIRASSSIKAYDYFKKRAVIDLKSVIEQRITRNVLIQKEPTLLKKGIFKASFITKDYLPNGEIIENRWNSFIKLHKERGVLSDINYSGFVVDAYEQSKFEY